jgi:hypothetical protein
LKAAVETAPGEAVLHGEPVALDRVLEGQRGADLEDLFARATVNQAELGKIGPEIATEAAAEFVDPGVKSRERVLEKVSDYSDPGEIKDLARGGFLVTDPAQADTIAAALAKRFPIYDKGWKPLSGYLDRKLIVRLENGGVAEIQIIPKVIADEKFGAGHALYERARDPKTPIDEFERLVREMKARYEALLEGTDFAALGKAEAKAASESSVPSSSAERTVETDASRQAPPSNTNPLSGSETATARSSSSNSLIEQSPQGNNGASVASPQVALEPGRLQLRRYGTPGTFVGRGYELVGDKLEEARQALTTNRAISGAVEITPQAIRFQNASLDTHFDALRKAKVPIDLVDLDGNVIRNAKASDLLAVGAEQSKRLTGPMVQDALERGAETDPAIADRNRQLVELGAKAPLRAGGDVDQLGEIGLGLFDQANQGKLTFRLGEEGDEVSAEDLLAELAADDKAIAAMKACL